MTPKQRSAFILARGSKCEFSGVTTGLEIAHIVSAHALGSRSATTTKDNFLVLHGCATQHGTPHHIFDAIYKPNIINYFSANPCEFENWTFGTSIPALGIAFSHEPLLQKQFGISFEWMMRFQTSHAVKFYQIEDELTYLSSLMEINEV